jgi:hypothetical protein
MFVVVMETLIRMLSVTTDRGLLSGLSMWSKNNDMLLVSHLLFTDDTLIFVRQILIIYVICVIFSYILKLSRGGRLTYLSCLYACAREMENQWATFFFTAMWLPLCGIPFLLNLVCFGLYLEESSTCLLIGGSMKGQRVLRFGRWCQFDFLRICLEGKKS